MTLFRYLNSWPCRQRKQKIYTWFTAHGFLKKKKRWLKSPPYHYPIPPSRPTPNLQSQPCSLSRKRHGQTRTQNTFSPWHFRHFSRSARLARSRPRDLDPTLGFRPRIAPCRAYHRRVVRGSWGLFLSVESGKGRQEGFNMGKVTRHLTSILNLLPHGRDFPFLVLWRLGVEAADLMGFFVG